MLWQLDGKVTSIEALIDNLTSVVQLAARSDCHQEMLTNNNLEKLFVRLKRQYPFFWLMTRARSRHRRTITGRYSLNLNQR